MAYVISDACVNCGTCVDNCPVEAIAEGDGKYVINADLCVDCGTCVDNCPVAIYTILVLHTSLKKWRLFFQTFLPVLWSTQVRPNRSS